MRLFGVSEASDRGRIFFGKHLHRINGEGPTTRLTKACRIIRRVTSPRANEQNQRKEAHSVEKYSLNPLCHERVVSVITIMYNLIIYVLVRVERGDS